MYAIAYVLFTGTVLHRAPSAKAALEAIELLEGGGATVVRINRTRTGQQVSLEELRKLADAEPRGDELTNYC